MADAKVQIGLSGEFLEGVSVDTPAGQNLFREGVAVSDPDEAQARAKVINFAPVGNEYGLAVRQVGVVSTQDSKQTGTWGYNAGSAGTLTLTGGKRVLSITATAPAMTDATLSINGGDTVIIPQGSTLSINPMGNVIDPVVLFSATASYFVEYVFTPVIDLVNTLLINAAGDSLKINATDLLVIDGDAPVDTTDHLLINAAGDRLKSNATDLLKIDGNVPVLLINNTDRLLSNGSGDFLQVE